MRENSQDINSDMNTSDRFSASNNSFVGDKTYTGIAAYITWQAKRLLPLLIIFSLVQFLFFSVPVLLGGGIVYHTATYDVNSYYPSYHSGVMPLFSVFFVLSLLLVLILVHRLFSFMHKQIAANFLFSLPFKRSTLFLANLILTYGFILAYRIISFVQNFIFVFRGSGWIKILAVQEAYCFIALGASAAMLMYFYTASANAFNAQILCGLANVMWPILNLALRLVGNTMFPGVVLSDWFWLISPYVAGIAPTNLSVRTWYWVFFTVVFLVLTYLRFNLRPAEKTGKYELHEKHYFVIKLVNSVALGLMFSVMLFYLRDIYIHEVNADWLITAVGLVSGSLITSMLFDLIFTRGVVKFSRSLGLGLVNLSVLLVLVAVMITGAFGWSKQLPNDKTDWIELRTNREDYSLYNMLNGLDYRIGTDRPLRIENPEQIARLGGLIGRNYNPDNPGLQPPLSLASGPKYSEFIIDKYKKLSTKKVLFSWKDDGALLGRVRLINLLGDFNEEIYQDLFRDPGVALLFQQRSSFSHWLDARVGIRDCDDDEDRTTCAKNNQTDTPWQVTLRHIAFLPPQSHYISSEDMIFHLLEDYKAMTEESRVALWDTAPYTMTVTIQSPFFVEEAAATSTNVDVVRADDYPRAKTVEEELTTESWEFPFDDNAHRLKAYLDKAYETYLKDNTN